MSVPPAALLDEDPDMLRTVVKVIEFSDKEAERRSKR